MNLLKLFVRVVLCAFVLFLDPIASAYEQPVHSRICENAADQSGLRDFLLNRLGLRPDPQRPDILEKSIGGMRIKKWIGYGHCR
jgi:hypothetical protein